MCDVPTCQRDHVVVRGRHQYCRQHDPERKHKPRPETEVKRT